MRSDAMTSMRSDASQGSMMMGPMPSLSAPFIPGQLMHGVPMMPMVPSAPPPGSRPPPSVGSALHANSMCRPCAWFHKKPKGCENGADCRHCHLCPEGEIQARRKAKLNMLRQQKGTGMEGESPTSHEMQLLAQMEKSFLAQWEMNIAAAASWDWSAWHEGAAAAASPFNADMMAGMGSPLGAEEHDYEAALLHAAAEAAGADSAEEAAGALEGVGKTPTTPAILNLDESLEMGPAMTHAYSMPPPMMEHQLSAMVSATRSMAELGTETGWLTVTDVEAPAAWAEAAHRDRRSAQRPHLDISSLQ